MILSLIHLQNQINIFNNSRKGENFDQTSDSGSKNLSNNTESYKIYPRIALVKPVFTATAYSSYYTWYPDTYLDPHTYLSIPVLNTWGTSYGAGLIKTSLINAGYPKSRVIEISDITVHKNLLFNNDDCFIMPAYI